MPERLAGGADGLPNEFTDSCPLASEYWRGQRDAARDADTVTLTGIGVGQITEPSLVATC